MEWALGIICFLAEGVSLMIGTKRRKIFLTLLLPMLSIHMLTQGMRWQMGIIYLFILLELVGFIIHLGKEKEKEKTPTKKIPIILWFLGFTLTFILIFVMRYNEMDELNGTYEVGTFAFDAVDEDRIELYGETAGENRKIRLQAWYPTDDVNGLEQAKWLYDGKDSAKGLPAYVGLPSFLLTYTSRFDSNSYLDAPLSSSKEKYPLIVISHGWYGFRNLHTDVAERLASEGYIVVCIEHTYGSLATVFDDGTVHFADAETLPSVEDEEVFAEAAKLLVETYSQDVKFTLDLMGDINKGEVNIANIFLGRIDMDLIGLMGHSTGGGGVVKTAMTDKRVDAVLGFDPWIEPIEEGLILGGLETPSLFLSSEQWKDRANDGVLEKLDQQESTVTKMYQLNGSYHQDFTMMYMFEPIANIIGFTGEIDAKRSREIQQEYALQFFDYWLLEKTNSLMNLVDNYNEVILKKWN